MSIFEIKPNHLFINQTLSNSLEKIIENSQNEIFLGYVRKMEMIKKDIQELKDKADAERLKVKRDEKI